MITPKFSCSQDELSVTVELYVPSVRASEVEIDVDGSLFSVHIKPYFLRLSFPGNVVEDDDSFARYDPSSGYLTVKLTKETKGEDFKDLDLLAKLLAPQGTTRQADNALLVVGDQSRDGGGPRRPLIEVIGETVNLDSVTDGDTAEGEQKDPIDDLADATAKLTLDREREILLEAEKRDWAYPQGLDELEQDDVPGDVELPTARSYGFLDAYSGYFTHARYSANEVNELGVDVERLAPRERRERRLAREEEKWDEEYYIADYVNDDEIQELIKWKSPYTTTESSPGSVQSVEFTEEENATMLRLPRKEYLTDAAQVGVLHHMLISILFGYAYDLRTTLDDPTPESAWTIASLTPAFSALDVSPFTTLSSTLISSYRRALAFPLYRNWSLCQTCQADVAGILKLGRRGVTRALLRTKRILDRHEAYYIYSKIWVDDFIVWVQSCATDAALHKLSGELRSFKLPKASVGWSLEELEAAAKDVQPDSDDETDEDDSQRPTPL